MHVTFTLMVMNPKPKAPQLYHHITKSTKELINAIQLLSRQEKISRALILKGRQTLACSSVRVLLTPPLIRRETLLRCSQTSSGEKHLQEGLPVSLSCVDKGLIVPPSPGQDNAARGVQCGHCVCLCDTGSQRWHRRHGCRITRLDGGEGGEVTSRLEVATCPRITPQNVHRVGEGTK